MEAAFIVGMVVGAIMTLAASYVLLKGSDFTLNILGFTAFGVLLIGMSVWSQVKIQLNEQGLSFEVLRQQVAQTAEAVVAIAEEVNVAAEALEVNQAQFAELARELARERVIPRDNLERFVRPSAELPMIDRAKLDTARAQVGRVMDIQSLRLNSP